jgi:hypothetical protein
MMYKIQITLLLCLGACGLKAQENSPYSRYGIGLLKAQENIASRGMGGTSVADNNGFLVNPTNPATFASFKMTTYQLGLEGSLFTVTNNSTSNKTGGLGLSYINMGIPLAKDKAGMSFGLLPYSRVKYNMQQQDSIPGISQVLYNYFGGGSIQKAYIGAAYKHKGFSLGATFGYLFGTYQNNVSQQFVDSLQILTSDILSRNLLNGVTWQVGALYEHTFEKERFLNIGVSYHTKADLNASRDKLWYSAFGDVTQNIYEYRADSVTNQKGTVNLPSNLGVGLLYGTETWRIGIDYLRSDWSKFKSFGQADAFQASSTLRLGGSYTPDANEALNYWKRLTYRAGAYYVVEPIYLNSTSFSTKALTAGLGYPIRRTNLSIGQINAAFDVGQRGTLSNGLVKESFTRFAVGITVNDKWFVKRRYD